MALTAMEKWMLKNRDVSVGGRTGDDVAAEQASSSSSSSSPSRGSRFRDNLGGDPAGVPTAPKTPDLNPSNDGGASTTRGGSSSSSTARRLMQGSKSAAKKTAKRLMQGSLESEADPTLGSEREATVEEKAAAGRKTRDFSSSGAADRFRENAKKVKDAVDEGLKLGPSGEPRTTNVSSGATGITVTNLKGAGASIADRVTNAMSRQSTGGDGSEPTIPGGGDGPSLNDVRDAVTNVNVDLPKIEIPTIANPLGGAIGKLKLLLGGLAVLVVVWVFGQLVDVQVGG